MVLGKVHGPRVAPGCDRLSDAWADSRFDLARSRSPTDGGSGQLKRMAVSQEPASIIAGTGRNCGSPKCGVQTGDVVLAALV